MQKQVHPGMSMQLESCTNLNCCFNLTIYTDREAAGMSYYQAVKSSSIHWSSSPRPTGTRRFAPAAEKKHLKNYTIHYQWSNMKYGFN